MSKDHEKGADKENIIKVKGDSKKAKPSTEAVSNSTGSGVLDGDGGDELGPKVLRRKEAGKK